ncbi:unnamed protein product, partial [Didymodactylos carnosus]
SNNDELDVLERLMQLDPKRRPNASETLKLEYFSNPPAPCSCERLVKDVQQAHSDHKRKPLEEKGGPAKKRLAFDE